MSSAIGYSAFPTEQKVYADPVRTGPRVLVKIECLEQNVSIGMGYGLLKRGMNELTMFKTDVVKLDAYVDDRHEAVAEAKEKYFYGFLEAMEDLQKKKVEEKSEVWEALWAYCHKEQYLLEEQDRVAFNEHQKKVLDTYTGSWQAHFYNHFKSKRYPANKLSRLPIKGYEVVGDVDNADAVIDPVAMAAELDDLRDKLARLTASASTKRVSGKRT